MAEIVPEKLGLFILLPNFASIAINRTSPEHIAAKLKSIEGSRCHTTATVAEIACTETLRDGVL
jgi:hypothetical protein